MTFEELALIIRDSCTPTNQVMHLKRTWNVHPWLIGDEEVPVLSKYWQDISQGQQFLIEQCTHDKDGNHVPTRVSLKIAEYSDGPFGPTMYPLQNLPSGRPEYNASRPIFSRWEKDANGRDTGHRTSTEQAMDQFRRSREMICDPDGPISQLRYESEYNYQHFFVYDCTTYTYDPSRFHCLHNILGVCSSVLRVSSHIAITEPNKGRLGKGYLRKWMPSSSFRLLRYQNLMFGFPYRGKMSKNAWKKMAMRNQQRKKLMVCGPRLYIMHYSHSIT